MDSNGTSTAAASNEHAKGMVESASFADLNMSSGGVRITVKGLTYSVPSFKDKKEVAQLLTDVSGIFNPGEMTALLGPSGSGKTTFLDVLAGRKAVGETTGLLLYGGKAPTQAFIRRYTGYVEQFDTLISALTVREMLCYTAELKRPMSEPLAEKEAAVDKLLHELGLWTARDVLVGNTMVKGISGGQAKRTNIAIALITNPSVLFLDEPTSGLDSFTANEVMSVVKSLVTRDTTIIATVHSPTAYAFSLFNHAMILCSGMQVYFGPNAGALMRYAQGGLPGIAPKDAGHSDIEWLIDVFTAADRRGDAGKFAEVYKGSALKRECDSLLAKVEAVGSKTSVEAERQLAATSSTTTPGWWAFWIMMKYRTRKNYADGEFLGPRLGDKVFLSILILTLYWGIGNDYSSDNVVNISAMLFMWTTLPAFGAASYVPQIVMERALFMRERADGLYNPVTYIVSKMFDEMLMLSGVSLVIAAMVFYAVQLSGSFLLFWLVYYFTLGNGVILAYLVSALSPNMEAANAILPTYVVTLLFFAGFLIRPADTPVYWQWYIHVDLMKYAWGALMINQWEDNDPIFLEGKTLLEEYDLKGSDKWGQLGALVLFFIVFFFFALLALTKVNHSRR
uniref:ABC transporter domain-containing protein n=1 Tax=Mantoniella antarctica TaxID=81844 RepID=A0A7S0SD37_9CHLO|mmetsp:Transcript_19665/g.48736  ORF Transcript_19665/g.48736 Transcript_19665/m.48736 type:complete len:622 (+) Transcript_19665:222-2087(+)